MLDAKGSSDACPSTDNSTMKSQDGSQDDAEQRIEPKRDEERLTTSARHDYSGFASLPPDVLISILCRSPSSDHDSLRNTCRAFRSTLNSDAYRSERAASGWVEVKTRLVSKEELYEEDYPDGPDVSDDEDDDGLDEEWRQMRLDVKKRLRRDEDLDDYYSDLGHFDSSYGYHDITQKVYVDGIVAGSISSVLIPRSPLQSLFHEATDAHSGELQEVGWALCDSQGRPKVRSINDAITGSIEGTEYYNIFGGFLHIISVRIPQAYRPLGCTNVISHAVRSAIAAPELEGKWTLATAMSDSEVYMTEEDKRIEDEQRDKSWRAGGTEDERSVEDEIRAEEEEERILKRRVDCAILDARTFLRVGYKQIPEVVGSEQNKPPWLFALPKFLKDPTKSFEEASNIQLHEPPNLPLEPTGPDKVLMNLVKESSNSMRASLNELRQTERMLNDFNGKEQIFLSQIEESEGDLAEMRQLLETQRQVAPDAPEEMWEVFQGRIEEMANRLQQERTTREQQSQLFRDEITRKRQEIHDATERFKGKVKILVNEKGASIRRSYSLHFASAMRIPEYIDILLEMVPAQQRDRAISEKDFNGCTPLHCAVMMMPELIDALQVLDMNKPAENYYAFIEKLHELGADKNSRNASGLTALGQYRSTFSSGEDFTRSFGINRPGDTPEAWQPFHGKMEQVLKPSLGETDADKQETIHWNPDANGDEGDMDEDDEEDVNDVNADNGDEDMDGGIYGQ